MPDIHKHIILHLLWCEELLTGYNNKANVGENIIKCRHLWTCDSSTSAGRELWVQMAN